jgi:hypothetical protein
MGSKELYVFNQALAAKSLWRMLFNKGLWGKVMKEKYLENKEVEVWLRQERKYFKGASNIWKGLVKAYDILGHWVVWKIGRGTKLIVGKDPWIGCSGNYNLSEPLRHALQVKGITCLVDATNLMVQEVGIQSWKNAESLELEGLLDEEWTNYTNLLEA